MQPVAPRRRVRQPPGGCGARRRAPSTGNGLGPAPPCPAAGKPGLPVYGPRPRTGIGRTRHGPPGPAWPRRLLVARSPWRPVGGDPCENWAKSGLMSDVRPGPRGAFGPVAIRGPFPQAGQRTTRRGVGKHPAPSGALRQLFPHTGELVSASREAPSTIRCIETWCAPWRGAAPGSREAPSTIRCIETHSDRKLLFESSREAPSTIRCIETLVLGKHLSVLLDVGKHPAPSGALRRQGVLHDVSSTFPVGKHPAPSGALRHDRPEDRADGYRRREAPSTIRCIETL